MNSRKAPQSRFNEVMAAYEGQRVSGVSAWLRWGGRVYLALQRDALRMNLYSNLALLFLFALGLVWRQPVIAGLALMIWLLMPFIFMSRIRRSFLRRQRQAGR